ncbi:hypothetical protein BOSE62_160294 [Bosea sp. 62]|nr:hypothetical protein BOSE46_10020 [Bosea sp. 46]CAD5248114.1 hypothetical protein BOSE21B_10226 [Bosea sp. 21B]CAD5267848.1 hypothetical protein BOSE7B_150911 [Bosea sp. 7B]VVT45603.1 hypothetical protein BOS5A_10851 [Bosea sp. EC-HK365B]VXA93560.1 hypothetical protein BOSE29B_10020 [Bosea sp. 29B]VXA93575.1 hypothetical protein BOSE125_10020 [Bosea sp. 125]VXB95695.1 hypothetical protein BOSE62_160294 [Bosea sp. 62]VXC58250.1 hypothetical protein BOSE127_190539 [Bosea sp. 127]
MELCPQNLKEQGKSAVKRQSEQSSEGRAHSLPPACGGEGLGMGGRKTGLGCSFMSRQAALPPTNPPHRKRGEGLRSPAAANKPFTPLP